MPLIEIRNGCAIEECKPMEISKRIRDFIIMPVNLANSIHRRPLKPDSSALLRCQPSTAWLNETP